MNDLWVYVGEGIGVYFGIVLSGESVPGSGMSRKSVKKLFVDKLGREGSSSIGCQ